MAIRFNFVLSNTKRILKQNSLYNKNLRVVPKGHIPVYVGDQAEKTRYVVPVSYLSHPVFQDFLHCAEAEYGFHHPMGGLTIPCTKETFFTITSGLNC